MKKRNVREYSRLCPTLGVIPLCLMLLAACSARTETQTVLMTPPSNLLENTSAPEWQPKTNGELARWAIERDTALQQCNADKSAIRAYYESAGKATKGD